MASELKRIERSVNVFVGKPVTWIVYGLLVAARYAWHGIVGCWKWLRGRYTASSARA
jgi:hypothetical protein